MARSLDDVLGIRNAAEAFGLYTRKYKAALAAQNHCQLVVLLAEARIGAELKAAQARGEVGAQGRRSDFARASGEVAPTIEEVGVSRQRASEMKRLSEVGEPAIRAEVERATEAGRRPSRNRLLDRIPVLAERPAELDRLAMWLRSGASFIPTLGIRNAAEAFGLDTRKYKAALAAQNHCQLVVLLAEARIGAELKAAQTRGEVGGPGGDRQSSIVRASDNAPATLPEVGIPRQCAAEMKRLSEVGEPAIRAEVDRATEAGRRPSRNRLLDRISVVAEYRRGHTVIRMAYCLQQQDRASCYWRGRVATRVPGLRPGRPANPSEVCVGGAHMARKPRAEPVAVCDNDGGAFAEIPDLLINSIFADKRRKEAAIREAASAVQDRTAPIVARIYRGEAAREDLHALLDECLDLQNYSDYLEPAANDLGRELAQALLVGSAAWVDRPEDPATRIVRNARREDAPSTREAIALVIMRMPALMQLDDRRLVSEALHALNDGTGTVPPFLAPAKKVGKGHNPKAVWELEEGILSWIWWRRGQLDHRGAAIKVWKEVEASKAGADRGTVEKWLEKARERHGAAEFDGTLEYHFQRGKGGDPFYAPGLSVEALLEERWKLKGTEG